MVLDVSQDELAQIWEDANLLFDEMQDTLKETPEVNENGCKHEQEYVLLDIKTYENICQLCGAVVSMADPISQEWNIYKDETGKFSGNQQRGDVWDSGNPYDQQCTMFRFGPYGNKNSLAFKLQQQLCFNHKQKTVWQVKKQYEHVAGLMGHSQDIVTTANLLWCACVEANILTRAEVRTGLIAICYYYACLNNNIVIDRSDISKYFECKNLSKGEKVFCTIMENIPTFRNITQRNIDPNENNSFFYYCNQLGLGFKFAIECDEQFGLLKGKLKGITPVSSIAGIIAYVVTKVHKKKEPTKKEISKKIKVCIPTINKVISMIEEINSKS